MTQPNAQQAPDSASTAATPTPQRASRMPACKDPFTDHDRWVMWLMLDSPLDRLCHTLMAGLLAQSYRGPDGGPGIVWESGEFWRYNVTSGAWAILPRFRIEQRLNLWSGHLVAAGDKTKVVSLTQRVKDSIMSCLETECTPPRPVFDNARRGIAFKNGFLGLDFKLEPNDPENFAQWSMPCAYYPLDELTEAGRFEGSLFTRFWASSGLPDDDMLLIGQHMYSALAGLGTQYGRALLLLGPKGAGKSQVLTMYEKLVPPDAVCNVTPQQLESDYHGAELRGKALNVCYELSSVNPIPDEAGTKAIIQGERVTRRPIRQAPVSFRPIAAHAFAANDFPSIVAPSSAFYDRWALVGFKRSFRGKNNEVPYIGRKIATDELELLVSWVVDCGRELQRTGRYRLTDGHHELVKEWKHRGDSVSAWVEEATRDMGAEPASSWWTITEAFDNFTGWCRAGHFPMVNRREFRRRIEAQGVNVVRSNGTRVALQRGQG